MRRDRIRFLGLIASDPRDVLFLARKARDAGVDATLFTFGSDVLYEHPDAAAHLRDLLVVTTYPLFPPETTWAGQWIERRGFSGASEEGMYNAVTFLLGKEDEDDPLDYAPPIGPCGAPDRSCRPPVWITVNGRGGFWPVRFRRYESGTGSLGWVAAGAAQVAASKVPQIHIPTPTFVLFVCCTLLCAAHAIGFLSYRRPALARAAPAAPAPARTPERPGARSPGAVVETLRSFFHLCELPVIADLDRTALLALTTLLAATQLATGLLLARAFRFRAGHRLCDSIFGGAALLAAAALLACAFLEAKGLAAHRARWQLARRRAIVDPLCLAARSRDGRLENDRSRDVTSWLVLTVSAGLAAPCAIFVFHVLFMDDERALATLVRLFAIGSGVSPLLPMALGTAVVALWLGSHVNRALLFEFQGFREPPSELPPAVRPLLRPYIDFMAALRHPTSSLVAILAPAVVLLVIHTLVVGVYLTIDGTPWNYVLVVLTLLCAYCVLQSLAFFLTLWVRLRGFLRALSWGPFADAFNRMPDALAKSPWRMWSSPPMPTTLQISVAHLRALASLGARLKPDDGQRWIVKPKLREIAALAGPAAQCLERVRAAASEGFVATLAPRGEIRDLLGEAVLHVVDRLGRAWECWPPAKTTLSDEKAGDEARTLNTIVWLRRKAPTDAETWVRIAEEFVAIRLVTFIHYGFAQLRNVLSFTLLAFLLSMTLLGSYPLQPRHPVLAFAWVVGLIGIGAIIWAFVDMDRDVTLSFIGRTPPGKVALKLDFVTNLLVYGAVPLLTLLATQFPGVGDALLSLFDPALRSRH